MTYHIRRVHDKEERSLYAGTQQGLDGAQLEASIRTGHTGYAHDVYCDVTDRVVVLVTPEIASGETLEMSQLREDIPEPIARPKNGNDRFLMMLISVLLAAIVARLFWDAIFR